MENQNQARKGRPLGSKNKGGPKFLHYNPKRWHPEFDLIVIESVAGKSNEEIGRLFGYTKEHVSNILSTPQAAEIKERIRTHINKSSKSNIEERLANIGEKAFKKMEDFLDKDDLAEINPFKFIAQTVRIAEVACKVSNPSYGNTTIVNGNAFVINNSQADNLKNALAKSMELDKIMPGDVIESKDISHSLELKKIG